MRAWNGAAIESGFWRRSAQSFSSIGCRGPVDTIKSWDKGLHPC